MDTFRQCERHGREKFQELHNALADRDAQDHVCDPLELHYVVDDWNQVEPDVTGVVAEALELERALSDSYTLCHISNRNLQRSAFYTNYFNPTEGAIICSFNDKSEDLNPPNNRLQWSNIAFRTWEKYCNEEQQPIKGLRTVWRHRISNVTSQEVITTALHNRGRQRTRGMTEFLFPEPEFFALIGCPNGSGVARMLTDFCISLGRQTIASVFFTHPELAVVTQTE